MLKLEGAITALVTPFKDGNVNYINLEQLVLTQINAGIKTLVACGTTAESTSLNSKEWLSCLKTCINTSQGKAKVIAGINTNSTAEAIEKANLAKSAGADGVLINPPHYNKPTEKGILNHYQQISKHTNISIIAYNIPGRSIINLNAKTIIELSEIDNVIGLKDASNNISHIPIIKRNVKNDFALLSGVDSSSLAFILQGGHGCISVISNLLPSFFQKLLLLALEGNFNESSKMFNAISPLIDALDTETNPVSIKFAMSYLEQIKNELRLPLLPATTSSEETIKKEIEKIKTSILNKELTINNSPLHKNF